MGNYFVNAVYMTIHIVLLNIYMVEYIYVTSTVTSTKVLIKHYRVYTYLIIFCMADDFLANTMAYLLDHHHPHVT